MRRYHPSLEYFVISWSFSHPNVGVYHHEDFVKHIPTFVDCLIGISDRCSPLSFWNEKILNDSRRVNERSRWSSDLLDLLVSKLSNVSNFLELSLSMRIWRPSLWTVSSYSLTMKKKKYFWDTQNDAWHIPIEHFTVGGIFWWFQIKFGFQNRSILFILHSIFIEYYSRSIWHTKFNNCIWEKRYKIGQNQNKYWSNELIICTRLRCVEINWV